MCGAHATVRGFLGELVSRSPGTHDLVVDMEAGLEHLSRGTGRHVSRFLAVVEPYYRSMETARRIAHLARELGVGDVQVVINKVRTAGDREAVVNFCTANGLRIVAEIPDDPTLAEAERHRRPPVEYAPHSPAVAAIRVLAATLGSES
jgi:CO dehydrogenase maturation factor